MVGEEVHLKSGGRSVVEQISHDLGKVLYSGRLEGVYNPCSERMTVSQPDLLNMSGHPWNS